jgi:hypothetical protein
MIEKTAAAEEEGAEKRFASFAKIEFRQLTIKTFPDCANV